MNKIPKVFEGKVESDGNNEKVYYKSKPEIKETSNKNINQKISEIFNSSNYIYKAKTNIKLKSGWTEKTIIGKNSTHLITMENELIPITDILDIKK